MPENIPKMCEKMLEVASRGGLEAEMCLALGLKSEKEFNSLIKQSLELSEAFTHAKVISLSFYEDLLLQASVGALKGFNFNALNLLLTVQFPHKYTKTPQESPERVNLDQLDQRIKELQKQLKDD